MIIKQAIVYFFEVDKTIIIEKFYFVCLFCV